MQKSVTAKSKILIANQDRVENVQEALSTALIRMLFGTAESKDVYRAHRWISAKSLGQSIEAAHGISLELEEDPHSEEVFANIVGLTEEEESPIENEEELFLEIIIARMFYKNADITSFDPLTRLFPGKPIPLSLLPDACAASKRDQRLPAAQVWSTLFGWKFSRPNGEDSKIVSDAFRSAIKKVETASLNGAPKQIAYAQFLRGYTTLMLPPLDGGRFDALRDYVPPDPVRLIYWKAPTLRVKQFREPESQPVTFLLDLEWLLEGYADFKKERNKGGSKFKTSDVEKSFPRLEELFINLLLMEAQGLNANLLVLCRSKILELPKITVKSGRAWDEKRVHLSFHSDDFMEKLTQLVANAERIIESERRMYGGEGFPGTSLFAGHDLETSDSTLVVVAIAEKNLRPTLPSLELLSKRGCAVVRVGNKRPRYDN